MGRPSRLIVSLRAAIKQRISQDLRPDDFELPKPPTLEEQLERRRSELRNGLTDRQRLFLFGKLSGLNDKNAALAAGYALSVAENTKQRLWKPQVRTAATVQGLTRAVPIGFLAGAYNEAVLLPVTRLIGSWPLIADDPPWGPHGGILCAPAL